MRPAPARVPGLPYSVPGQARASGKQPAAPELVQALTSVFRSDPRPGLIFELGHLVLANDAARRAFAFAAARGAILTTLRRALANGRPPRDLRVQASGVIYRVETLHTRGRAGHWATVCFLLEEPPVISTVGQLSVREADVAGWLLQGNTNAEIAERLSISVETVRKHVASILKKSGTHTRAALVAKALGGIAERRPK